MVNITGLSNNPVQIQFLRSLYDLIRPQIDDIYDYMNYIAALEKSAKSMHDHAVSTWKLSPEEAALWIKHAKLDWEGWDSKNDKPKTH